MSATRVININPTAMIDASVYPTNRTDASFARTDAACLLKDVTVALNEAADILRRGGLVAFPTETVYGLGANALDAGVVERIYAAKGRPPTNPVIVHVADAAMARDLTSSWHTAAKTLAQMFWPGPLTLVLPKAKVVPDIVTAGRATVALRVPAHPIALALLRAAALPVAAPSANLSTHLSPTTTEHVLRGLDGRIDLIIDGGPTTGGIESTVVDLTGPQPVVLRPGLIGADALSRALGVKVAQLNFTTSTDESASAPGQHARHYSPRTAMTLAKDDGWSQAQTLARQGERIAWVGFGVDEIATTPIATTQASVETAGDLVIRRLPLEPTACAAALYALLHELDDLKLTRIVVAQPPAGDEWRAIRDRLQRAAAD